MVHNGISSVVRNRTRRVFWMSLLVVVPVAIMRFASVAEASGYNVAAGINGEVICNPGGDQDCPQS